MTVACPYCGHQDEAGVLLAAMDLKNVSARVKRREVLCLKCELLFDLPLAMVTAENQANVELHYLGKHRNPVGHRMNFRPFSRRVTRTVCQFKK